MVNSCRIYGEDLDIKTNSRTCMASAAVCSKAIILLLFIHWLLLLPLFVFFLLVLCFLVQYFVSFLVLQSFCLAGEERAGCFIFVVF